MTTPTIYMAYRKSKMRVRLPFAKNNRYFLGEVLPAGNFKWHKEGAYWEIARTHAPVVILALWAKYGGVKVAREHSVNERCNASCQNAQGWDCSCAGQGEHHGAGSEDSWMNVGGDVLVRPAGLMLVTRTYGKVQE